MNNKINKYIKEHSKHIESFKFKNNPNISPYSKELIDKIIDISKKNPSWANENKTQLTALIIDILKNDKM